MSGAVVEAAAHTVVEGGKKPPEEEDKKVGEGGGTHINLEAGNQITYASTLHGQDLHRLGGADKTQVPTDTQESARQGGSAMMNKGHVLLSQKHQTEDTHLTADAEEPHLSGGTQQTHLLAVTEEDDASKRLLLKRKKGKKRKRSELVEVKKEHQLGDAEKTEVPADTTEPTSEGGSAMINNQQTHLPVLPEEDDALQKMQMEKRKGKKRKRSELVKEETQVPANIEDCPIRWHASYSTLLLKRLKRVSKGSILIDPKDNRVILYDADEESIDHRFLKGG